MYFSVITNSCSNLRNALTFAGNQAKQAPVSTQAPPVVKPIVDDPTKAMTPIKVNNLSIAWRPASLSEESAVLLTKAEIKATFK